jgi:hypothetical protein
MTSKVYRTAQGKIVDMGSITLQNEMVRAVGNMNVNARGDRLDGANKVIDSRNRQVQRQVQRQSNMSDAPIHTSTVTAKQSRVEQPEEEILFDQPVVENPVNPVDIAVPEIAVAAAPAPVDLNIDQSAIPAGGLAAALAKAKTVKQTLDLTPRERAQAQGVRKL